MQFGKLTPPEQRYAIAEYLPAILAALTMPAPTAVIVARLARVAGFEGENKEIAAVLLALAKTHPRAKQDGEPFKRYGRTMRGWNWYPPQIELAGSPVQTVSPPPIGQHSLAPVKAVSEPPTRPGWSDTLGDWSYEVEEEISDLLEQLYPNKAERPLPATLMDAEGYEPLKARLEASLTQTNTNGPENASSAPEDWSACHDDPPISL